MAVKKAGRNTKARRSSEQSGKLLSVLREWQKLEDATIKYAEDMGKKTKNRLIKMTMDMIKSDSQKHKVMQQMLIDSLTKEPFVLSPDELGDLSAGLNRHMAAEARSLELADEALQNSELFVTRYILSYLIADEQKHHKMLANLNELKRATVFVT